MRSRPWQRAVRRYLRRHIQALAAIGTVLAGLMSVPALIISLNALKQQRHIEETAFVRRVAVWTIDAMSWTVRNNNAHPVYLYVRWKPSAAQPYRIGVYPMDPCSQGTIDFIHEWSSLEVRYWTWVVTDAQRSDVFYPAQKGWGRGDATPIDMEPWFAGNQASVGTIKYTKRDIGTCT